MISDYNHSHWTKHLSWSCRWWGVCCQLRVSIILTGWIDRQMRTSCIRDEIYLSSHWPDHRITDPWLVHHETSWHPGVWPEIGCELRFVFVFALRVYFKCCCQYGWLTKHTQKDCFISIYPNQRSVCVTISTFYLNFLRILVVSGLIHHTLLGCSPDTRTLSLSLTLEL